MKTRLEDYLSDKTRQRKEGNDALKRYFDLQQPEKRYFDIQQPEKKTRIELNIKVKNEEEIYSFDPV